MWVFSNLNLGRWNTEDEVEGTTWTAQWDWGQPRGHSSPGSLLHTKFTAVKFWRWDLCVRFVGFTSKCLSESLLPSVFAIVVYCAPHSSKLVKELIFSLCFPDDRLNNYSYLRIAFLCLLLISCSSHCTFCLCGLSLCSRGGCIILSAADTSFQFIFIKFL